MSPGSRPRPSLSGLLSHPSDGARRVSPGSRPRPSLSDDRQGCSQGWRGVSPGSRLRPSLSELGSRPTGPNPQGVAGVSAPAFVERASRAGRPSSRSCVAGVSAPAFVERRLPGPVHRGKIRVSPGSRPRPSLSEGACVPVGREGDVSPGSRPRPSLSGLLSHPSDGARRVSPGSRPRPSLSDDRQGCSQGWRGVSPGSRPRPSLSAVQARYLCSNLRPVAGVSAPAFVERARSGLWARCGLCGRRVSAPLTPLRRWQDDKA